MISIVILTKNEEKNIERCVKSVKFADEIVVIDDRSTDKTVEIAEKLGVKVYKRDLNGDFSSQRNFGMEKARGEWILFIDSDEEVTTELKDEIASEILRFAQDDTPQAYRIKRRDFWWGRELKFGETINSRNQGILRFIRKKAGKWEGKIHETFQTSKPTGRLNSFLNHYPHQTVAEFLRDVNFYSTERARELKNNGCKTNILEIVFYPFIKFILTYFIYLGFLDGAPGFVYSFMMSFHSFLVRSKLYLINHKT